MNLAGVFLGALLALGGCATQQVTALSLHWPEDTPSRALLTGVPFYPQEDYECGPAALAMVLQAAGIPVSPVALVEQVYVPARKGAFQPEMLAAARRRGTLAYPLAPNIESIVQEIHAGHPVLVFQNLSLPVYPVWHYAVAIGFDRERNVLILHTGKSAKSEISLYAFERTWARGNYWAAVVLPPAILPATAQADSLAQAAAALERVDAPAALATYNASLQRWPTHAGLMFGAGNAAYSAGDRNLAEHTYAALVLQHPDFADAWNNLAQVTWELGHLEDARSAIARAVALGGPRLANYQQLQTQLMRP